MDRVWLASCLHSLHASNENEPTPCQRQRHTPPNHEEGEPRALWSSWLLRWRRWRHPRMLEGAKNLESQPRKLFKLLGTRMTLRGSVQKSCFAHSNWPPRPAHSKS